MIYIRAFKTTDKHIWDTFVQSSRNATFLFERSFMDYHSDRFCDASLLVHDDKQRLRALFPATWHEDDKEIRSHGGLTYGGLVLGQCVGVIETCVIVNAVVQFYREKYEANQIIVSPVPSIYHDRPADDQIFALYRCGAILFKRYVSTTIPLDKAIVLSTNRKRQVKKALKQGFSVKLYSSNVDSFWSLLAATLSERHNVHPVHSLEELQLLIARFPNNISLHLVEDTQGALVGGTLLFHTPRVVHAQYIAASSIGRKFGALDLLFTTLLEQLQARPLSEQPRYFDFGTSMDNEGTEINAGLVAQKESFGGHTICYDKYVLQLS